MGIRHVSIQQTIQFLICKIWIIGSAPHFWIVLVRWYILWLEDPSKNLEHEAYCSVQRNRIVSSATHQCSVQTTSVYLIINNAYLHICHSISHFKIQFSVITSSNYYFLVTKILWSDWSYEINLSNDIYWHNKRTCDNHPNKIFKLIIMK